MTKYDYMVEKHAASLAESLEQAAQKVIAEYEAKRQAGQKGGLSHIYVSFLQSSVLCRLPWFKIDLCGECGLEDLAACGTDWDTPGLAEELCWEADALVKKGGQMKDYEIEQVWLDLSGGFYEAFGRLLPEIIALCPSAQKAGCRWHFGQYLGETIKVWGASDEVF
jgi:hypothetical protein